MNQPDKTEKSDEFYMRRCFDLARRGMGKTSPNPLVGAVIVKGGQIIGEGWHQAYGSAHAEVNAFLNATTNVTGATLYCNLEPCCHTKKQTPPCAPLVIQKKIKRVVISTPDPNPQVSGQSMQMFEKAGMAIVSGVLEEEGRQLNRFYFKYIRSGIPYVTLKIAQTLDGKISQTRDSRTAITGHEALKYVHQMRTVYDAVLIGANTVKVDDPQLNVRYAGGRPPKRIIIDGTLSCPISAKLFNDSKKENTIVFTGTDSGSEKINQLKAAGVRIFQLEQGANGLSLKEILKILGREKINSVLVEGGQNIFSQFIGQNLFDEINVLTAPTIFGSGINAVQNVFYNQLKLVEVQNLNQDILMRYQNERVI